MPELFAPETVLALVESRRRLRELQSVALARDAHRTLRLSTQDGAVSKLALIDETDAKGRIQFEAGWSYRQLAALVEQLRAEGGRMPAAAQPTIRLPQGPLPPNPFGTPPSAKNLAFTAGDGTLEG